MLKQKKPDELLSQWTCVFEGIPTPPPEGLSLAALRDLLEYPKVARLSDQDCIDLVIESLCQLRVLYRSGEYDWSVDLQTLYYDLTTGIVTFSGPAQKLEPWENFYELARVLTEFFDFPSNKIVQDASLREGMIFLLNKMMALGRRESFRIYEMVDDFRRLREEWRFMRAPEQTPVLGFLDFNEFQAADENQREAFFAALSAVHQVVLTVRAGQSAPDLWWDIIVTRELLEAQGLRVRRDMAWYWGHCSDAVLEAYTPGTHASRTGFFLTRVSSQANNPAGKLSCLTVHSDRLFDNDSVDLYRHELRRIMKGETLCPVGDMYHLSDREESEGACELVWTDPGASVKRCGFFKSVPDSRMHSPNSPNSWKGCGDFFVSHDAYLVESNRMK